MISGSKLQSVFYIWSLMDWSLIMAKKGLKLETKEVEENNIDIYYTIQGVGESKYVEKMSRFLGFAIPVTTAEEARQKVKQYQNAYHDSRHVCWAYMLGEERKEWQLNDNGEPSGTAGKPILGQINSNNLTNVLVIVVRYFGGIKLGTPGLISAYREAAREALEAAGIKECQSMEYLEFTFPYVGAESIMRLIKNGGIKVVNQEFDNTCRMRIEIAKSQKEEIFNRLISISGVSLL